MRKSYLIKSVHVVDHSIAHNEKYKNKNGMYGAYNYTSNRLHTLPMISFLVLNMIDFLMFNN